ncbi:MAG: sodium:alanine symporter family protein [candidate division KSB1 bacterium]|nr:sodium:alanine symporter family protein [candidate division KSB1 bacterium]
MEQIKDFIQGLASIVWGWPSFFPLMVLILLGTGIYVTFRLKWIQLSKLGHSIHAVLGKYSNPNDPGDITHFQTLSAVLSATVGIGNIAGVATAIYYGGPGALFWMWVTAVFGMALKYAEATLAVRYRVINADGSASGGPMYYIEKGLGRRWKPLAVAFAAFAVISSMGTGNSIQAFTCADQILSEFKLALPAGHFLITPINFLGISVEPVRIAVGLFLASTVALVIIGGIRRIGKVTAWLSPIMGLIYFIAGSIILLLNWRHLPSSFAVIFSQAFSPRAELIGFTGGGFMLFLNTMIWGVKRGLFSNEAGQGSAPIGHAASKTKEPAREGTVSMLGPFIDTLVICSITGLVIVCTNSYEVLVNGSRMNSSPLTAYAFRNGLAPLFAYGDKIVTLSVFLFAISTAISWSYYGDRAAEYLFGRKAVLPYKWVYVLFHFIGAIVPLEVVWGFGDVALGLMAVPNLIALIALSNQVVAITEDYFSRRGEWERR